MKWVEFSERRDAGEKLACPVSFRGAAEFLVCLAAGSLAKEAEMYIYSLRGGI